MQKPIFELEGLVDILDVDQSIRIDLKYATSQNFTRLKLYAFPLGLLRYEMAKNLAKASFLAQREGFFLKIWDAYRPVSVQKFFHDITPEDQRKYIPSVEKSVHPRGIAVDLTLTDIHGKELDMPTEFDDFSTRAHANSTEATPTQIENRERLREIMKNSGFEMSPVEWWHFNGAPLEKYSIIDLDFNDFVQQRKIAVDNLGLF